MLSCRAVLGGGGLTTAPLNGISWVSSMGGAGKRLRNRKGRWVSQAQTAVMKKEGNKSGKGHLFLTERDAFADPPSEAVPGGLRQV